MSQPAPQPGRKPVAEVVVDRLESLLTKSCQQDLWESLSTRLLARVEAGYEKYGTFLMTENGRDPLQDAWEEAADLVMYLTQSHMEGGPVHRQLMHAEELLCSLTQIIEREAAA